MVYPVQSISTYQMSPEYCLALVGPGQPCVYGELTCSAASLSRRK
jgi:hypothetical protein